MQIKILSTSKIAPKGFVVSIELKNNIKYKLRGRFADKTVLKEVYKKRYDQFGVKVEDGDLVIDIGAHIGFGTYAAEKNKSGTFEPFHDNLKRLKFHKTNITKYEDKLYCRRNGKKIFLCKFKEFWWPFYY